MDARIAEEIVANLNRSAGISGEGTAVVSVTEALSPESGRIHPAHHPLRVHHERFPSFYVGDLK